MERTVQVSKSGTARDDPAEMKKEHFAKLLHLLWDLELIQRFLPERQDILVLLCMLRYADFDTGQCTVFIGKIADEAGIENPTQVRRIFEKIVRMGAFSRPAGKKAFKTIYGKSACRFCRSTGKQILEHAISNDLLSKEKLREVELRHAQEEIDAEAAAAGASGEEADGGEPADMTGLEDVPESIYDLTD
jgi:hypothetical protein